MSGTTNTSADPRCPYCGRPVIGAFVQGGEGRYHPACVQPPLPIEPFNPSVPIQPWDPSSPYRVCHVGPSQAERDGTIRAENNNGN